MAALTETVSSALKMADIDFIDNLEAQPMPSPASTLPDNELDLIDTQGSDDENGSESVKCKAAKRSRYVVMSDSDDDSDDDEDDAIIVTSPSYVAKRAKTTVTEKTKTVDITSPVVEPAKSATATSPAKSPTATSPAKSATATSAAAKPRKPRVRKPKAKAPPSPPAFTVTRNPECSRYRRITNALDNLLEDAGKDGSTMQPFDKTVLTLLAGLNGNLNSYGAQLLYECITPMDQLPREYGVEAKLPLLLKQACDHIAKEVTVNTTQ